MHPTAPALEAHDVCVRYAASGEDALRGISLKLYPGEVLAVLGPNGAGKSTVIKAVTGLLGLTRGWVRLFGTDLSQLDRRQIARKVAVVQQQADVAFGFCVRDVVMMGRAPHQGTMMRATDDDQRIIDEVLERTDLTRLQGRSVTELSGGEQKRVAIARALAQQPDILMLDEATAHLDIRHGVELHALVRREVRERGLACLAVMHDLNEAAQNASRVLLIDNGTIRATGSIAEVMTYRMLRDTFGVDLYVGINEVDGTRYFIPMREREGADDQS